MDEYGYLIPANAKKSQLIFGLLTGLDAIILGCGITATVILLLVLNTDNVLWTVVACLPLAITTFLVALPIPNYHNVRVVIKNFLRFYNPNINKKYKWKGWCIYDEFDQEN